MGAGSPPPALAGAAAGPASSPRGRCCSKLAGRPPPAHLLGAALPQPAGGATATWPGRHCGLPRRPTGRMVGGPTQPGLEEAPRNRAGKTLSRVLSTPPTAANSHFPAPHPLLVPSPPATCFPSRSQEDQRAHQEEPPSSLRERERGLPYPSATRRARWPPFMKHALCAKLRARSFLALTSINPHNSSNYENISFNAFGPAGPVGSSAPVRLASLSPGYLCVGPLQSN